MNNEPPNGEKGGDPTKSHPKEEPRDLIARFKAFVLDWRFIAGLLLVCGGAFWNKVADTAIAPYRRAFRCSRESHQA